MEERARFLSRDPEARIFETPSGRWFLSGMEGLGHERAVRRLEAAGTPPVDIVRRIGPGMEEGTIVFLPSPGFPDPRVLAFKSVICSREIYWVLSDKEGIVLSDRFADILPELPPEARKVCERRAVHFLMGCNLRGDWTLVEAVHRVGHGELLLFTRGEKVPGKRKIQRFSWESTVRDPEEALQVMEKALDKVAGILAPVRNKAMMFSGGVDSTLVWSSLRPRIPAVTGYVDTDPGEMETAKAAAIRHGIDCGFLRVKETGFLDDYRRALEDVGLPFIISNFQMLYYMKAFESGFTHLVSGELADSIWGMSHMVRIFQEGPEEDYSCSIASSPLSPAGYGIRVHLLLPDDLQLLFRLYGEQEILGCLGNNLSYALDCLDPAVPLDRDFRSGHADLGSLAFILNGSWRSNYRQAGYVHGVGLSFPFETLSMVKAALSIALPGRILSPEGQTKPLIHRLLARKLPGAVAPRKSGSGLPRTRYCQEGPFAGFFREHPVPAFWPSGCADLLENPTRESSSLVMKCISLQMWEKEVLRPRSSSGGKLPLRPPAG